MFKQVTFKTKGMLRDLSKSSFTKDYAYENKNMRLTCTDDGILGSMTNEKGTKAINIIDLDTTTSQGTHPSLILNGTPIGQAIIDNVYIVFTHYEAYDEQETLVKKDYIYKIYQDNEKLVGTILYEGDLNFNTEYPIETLPYYENNKVRKVYWTDNYNQPRLINIDKDYKETITTVQDSVSRYDSSVFDFVPTLKLEESIIIQRIEASDGQFPAGVVQYYFTYFDLYGHESNVFFTSSLYYTSFNDRGAKADEKVGNAFKIVIRNLDTSFDYVRVYCAIRTSINDKVLVRKVKDVKLSFTGSLSSVSLIDDGIIGEDVDDYSLLFKGGIPITAKTIAQKDNTLFIGNIKEKAVTLPKDKVVALKNAITSITNPTEKGKEKEDIVSYSYKETKVEVQNGNYSYSEKSIALPSLDSYYPWNNSLQYSSDVITTFKARETYRFGLQFQHNTGKWSEVIWLGDYKNNVVRKQDYPDSKSEYDYTTVYKTIASISPNETLLATIKTFESDGFIKVRPVIVYPSLAERDILCQRILCPTVFNVSDRKNNAPFAQSSWFIRPNLSQQYTDVAYLPLYGNVKEFRHYHPLPAYLNRNAEIQCNSVAPDTPTLLGKAGFDDESNDFVSYFKDNFYVDQSIVTFHSPDIEFDDNLKNTDLSLYKCRIVGIVPITAHSSDIDISAGSTLGLNGKDTLGTGFYKYAPKSLVTYRLGGGIYTNPSRALSSGSYWIDGVARKKSDKTGTDYISITANQRAYVIYPWHREVSLNNDINYSNYTASSTLKHKRISNFYSSYDSLYFNYSDTGKDAYELTLNDAKLFDSDEASLIKLHSPIEDEEDISYYGNIDRVITPSTDNVPAYNGIAAQDKTDGYSITVSKQIVGSDGSNAMTAFTGKYVTIQDSITTTTGGTPVYKVNDPIHIKYKSTPHAVFTLKGSVDKTTTTPVYTVNILPTTRSSKGVSYNITNTTYTTSCFWDNKILKIKQSDLSTAWGIREDSTDTDKDLQYGYLWLAELYRSSVNNKFGGNDEVSLAQNEWMVAGKSLAIDNVVDLKWTTGDTYYQRYDHIKTYPFTTEDKNSVSEVISFMCESRVNLDGRCDRNRLNYNNLIITPEKFNLMNDVYNQKDSYFTYHAVDSNKKSVTEYSNTLSWGNTKNNGEDIDSWTNINLAASLEFDGNLGPINSIKKFNNDLIVFQDKGVSVVSYNENVQISSTNGVPIEILNSGKVTGKRYISNNIGSINKWSICTTPDGVFFIDDNSKNIYVYNSSIKNISDTKGFNTWVRQHSVLKEWSPKTFDNYIAHYDNINNEILFIGKEDCLVYSLKVNEFTSFYDYNNSPWFFNLYDKGIFIHNDSNIGENNYLLWEEHAGEYNMFFSEYKPYWTEVIVNEEILKDKIFNNVEYNADTWVDGKMSDITFDVIDVYNEYQQGSANLIYAKYKSSILKRKFRTWRIQIPRTKEYHSGKIHNRIRNPWMGLRLTHGNNDNAKMLLHDITVSYSCN